MNCNSESESFSSKFICDLKGLAYEMEILPPYKKSVTLHMSMINGIVVLIQKCIRNERYLV
jgi:hypothetical protein